MNCGAGEYEALARAAHTEWVGRWWRGRLRSERLLPTNHYASLLGVGRHDGGHEEHKACGDGSPPGGAECAIMHPCSLMTNAYALPPRKLCTHAVLVDPP